MKSIYRINLLFYTLSFCFNSYAQDSKIIWADRIIKSTNKFEYEDNHTGHILGMPSLYQGQMYGNVDAFADGYVVRNQDKVKKNSIKVGFPEKVNAQQLIIGGVLNMGTIQFIYAHTSAGKKVEIYQMFKGSVSKFHNFYTFFSPMEIVAIEIEIDHQKIRDWNLIKGVGLTTYDRPVELVPDLYTDDEFFGREKVNFHPRKDNCMIFNAKVAHSGREVYFTKECYNNREDDQDIWIAKMGKDGAWTPAMKADFPLNNNGHNFVASVGPDDKFLILGNTYHSDGTHAGDGVSISHKKTDGSWDIPKNISITGFKNLNFHANFFMSQDERLLLMAIEDDKSRGDLDLYVSFFDKNTGVWSKPLNLGPEINTHFKEDYPYLSNDGRTLFFSSTGYVGFGGQDIYVTQRLDFTWQTWSKPRNIGPLVNSRGDDYGFTISSSGYEAYFNSPNFESDTVIDMECNKVSLPKLLRLETEAEITGHILSNDDTTKKISALIRIKKFDGHTEYLASSDSKTGKYSMTVPAGYPYLISVENENFFKKEENMFTVESGNNYRIMKSFYLSSLPDSGASYKIENLVFAKGTANLDLTIAGHTLDSISAKIKTMPINFKVEIGGHTDSKGDANKNRQISYDRAKAVACYIVDRGVPEDQIIIKGYGSEVSIADNTTDEGRIANRRVTVSFITKLNKSNNTAQTAPPASKDN